MIDTASDSYQSTANSEILNTMSVKSIFLFFLADWSTVIYVVLPKEQQIKLEWPKQNMFE